MGHHSKSAPGNVVGAHGGTRSAPGVSSALLNELRRMDPSVTAAMVNGPLNQNLDRLPTEIRDAMRESLAGAEQPDAAITAALHKLDTPKANGPKRFENSGETSSSAHLTEQDLGVVEAETSATLSGLIQNPVTNMVANEAALYDTLKEAKAGGRDAAVMLADLNKFSTYNNVAGMEAGDEAIRLASRHLARSAERLTELYPDFEFLPGRKSGDEMFMTAVPREGRGTHVPDVVGMDMARVYLEELQAFNAASKFPIPTGSAGVGIVRPGSYSTQEELAGVLHAIDAAPVDRFNNAPSPEEGYERNAALFLDLKAGNERIIPGSVYQTNFDQELPEFRAMQGGLRWEYPRINTPNVVNGDHGRPMILPGAAVNLTEAPPLTPPASTIAGTQRQLSTDPVARLNEARAMGGIESNMRPLAADGIEILDQTTALPRLDYIIESARRDGGEVMLEFYEPRGLKDLNDRAYYVDAEGQRQRVGHHGGDIAIENMVRANDQAIAEVLGPDAKGLVTQFRDRGKRFGNMVPPGVTSEQWTQVQQRRDEIYRDLPAEFITQDGGRFPVMMPDASAAGGYPFKFSMGYGAMRLDPSQFPDETATSFRERMVAPVIQHYTPEGPALSILDVGKEISDGSMKRELQRRLDASGVLKGVDILLPPEDASRHPDQRIDRKAN
jgi:GGDEF domain-containing protein